MKENTQLSLFFENISGKKVIADFNGGDVTSDGGALLLRSVEKRTGLIRSHCKVLSDNRDKRYTDHSLYEMISQRVYQISCGYEDANDSDILRHDPAFKSACNRLPLSGAALASQPTISRLENRVSRTDLYRLGLAQIAAFVNSYRKAPRSIIIDVDDTADIVHGGQQLSLFNAHYNEYCYQPMHFYEGRSGKLITAVLRPGKRPKGREIFSILKRVVLHIRKQWPHVKIILRGDSHFSVPEVHAFCYKHNLGFVLGQSINTTIKSMAPAEILKEIHGIHGKDIRWYTDTFYQAKSWHRENRLIIKTSVTSKGCDVRAVVTNLPWKSYTRIYEKLYCGRGNMENMIKNHKSILRSDRTSCTRFEANQLRLFLHGIAYSLLHRLQKEGLRGTEFETAQFDTIQRWLLRVGAQVIERTRKILFHLPSSYTMKELFAKVHNRFVFGFT